LVNAQKVWDRLDPDHVLDLAKAICSVPSPLGDEGRLAELIADLVDRPTVDVHVEQVVAGRPNVVATVQGQGRRDPLVLQGHLDSGIVADGWTHDPYSPWVSDGRLYAGGVSDMKAGLAAMVAALQVVADGEPPPGDLVLHAVMHHDGTGLGSKYVLASEGPRSGFAICGEPSGLAIHTANGGAMKFEIEVTGRTAHISRMDEGADALAAATQIYGALRHHSFQFEPHPRLPDLPMSVIGQLTSGRGPGTVPAHALIKGDVRTVPSMRRIAVKQELTELAKAAVGPEVGVRVRISAVHQPFLGVLDGPLVDAIGEAHQLLRGTPVRTTNELPGQAFVTDAADLAAAGLDTVVYGPGDWHFAPDEWVRVDDVVDAARVYAAVAVNELPMP
jgi:acetylornithine deacetylase/succinyl-diaminopimelate desuccinylase-like protein